MATLREQTCQVMAFSLTHDCHVAALKGATWRVEESWALETLLAAWLGASLAGEAVAEPLLGREGEGGRKEGAREGEREGKWEVDEESNFILDSGPALSVLAELLAFEPSAPPLLEPNGAAVPCRQPS